MKGQRYVLAVCGRAENWVVSRGNVHKKICINNTTKFLPSAEGPERAVLKVCHADTSSSFSSVRPKGGHLALFSIHL